MFGAASGAASGAAFGGAFGAESGAESGAAFGAEARAEAEPAAGQAAAPQDHKGPAVRVRRTAGRSVGGQRFPARANASIPVEVKSMAGSLLGQARTSSRYRDSAVS